MYIECISNGGFEDQLTTGNAYQAIKIENNSYAVINDKNKEVWYGQSHFKVKTL